MESDGEEMMKRITATELTQTIIWKDYQENPPEMKMFPNGDKETVNILVCTDRGEIAYGKISVLKKSGAGWCEPYFEVYGCCGFESETELDGRIIYWVEVHIPKYLERK
jgi:hypothetical protein